MVVARLLDLPLLAVHVAALPALPVPLCGKVQPKTQILLSWAVDPDHVVSLVPALVASPHSVAPCLDQLEPAPFLEVLVLLAWAFLARALAARACPAPDLEASFRSAALVVHH
jgi:hypothetical protein